MIEIREESEGDREAIFTVHFQAFKGEGEPRLVDALRGAHASLLSLVAVSAGKLCGHVLYSAVTPDVNSLNKNVLGLAPLAVLPNYQNQGVGALLTRSGLEKCETLGYDAVVVLGSSTYYPRFGFRPAADFNLFCEYPVAPEYFMALELQTHGLEGCRGLARYHRLFNDLDV